MSSWLSFVSYCTACKPVDPRQFNLQPLPSSLVHSSSFFLPSSPSPALFPIFPASSVQHRYLRPITKKKKRREEKGKENSSSYFFANSLRRVRHDFWAHTFTRRRNWAAAFHKVQYSTLSPMEARVPKLRPRQFLVGRFHCRML